MDFDDLSNLEALVQRHHRRRPKIPRSMWRERPFRPWFDERIRVDPTTGQEGYTLRVLAIRLPLMKRDAEPSSLKKPT